VAITVEPAGGALLAHTCAGPVDAFRAVATALAKAHPEPVVVVAPHVTARDDGFALLATALAGRYSTGIRLIFLGGSGPMLRREEGLRAISDQCGHTVTGSFGPVAVAADGTCSATGWISLSSVGTQYSPPWSPPPPWPMVNTGTWDAIAVHGLVAAHPVPAGLWLLPAGLPLDRSAVVPALSRDPHGMLVFAGGCGKPLPAKALADALTHIGLAPPARLILLPLALDPGTHLDPHTTPVPSEPVTAVWSTTGWQLVPDHPTAAGELLEDPLSILWPTTPTAISHSASPARPPSSTRSSASTELSPTQFSLVAEPSASPNFALNSLSLPTPSEPLSSGAHLPPPSHPAEPTPSTTEAAPPASGPGVPSVASSSEPRGIPLPSGLDPSANNDAGTGEGGPADGDEPAETGGPKVRLTGALRSLGETLRSKVKGDQGTAVPVASGGPPDRGEDLPGSADEAVPGVAGKESPAPAGKRPAVTGTLGGVGIAALSSGLLPGLAGKGLVGKGAAGSGGLAVPKSLCDAADRERLRGLLNGTHEKYTAEAAKLIGAQPESEDLERAVAGLAALRAYWADWRHAVDRLLATGQADGNAADLLHLAGCAKHGLSRLPAVFGPVFAAAAEPVELAVGTTLTEPGFLEVLIRPADFHDAATEYVVWSLTARRLGKTVPGGSGRALFGPGARFTVLGVDRDGACPRILLLEQVNGRSGHPDHESAGDEGLADRLRAMASAASASASQAPAAARPTPIGPLA
jgi:hypothetical protein